MIRAPAFEKTFGWEIFGWTKYIVLHLLCFLQKELSNQQILNHLETQNPHIDKVINTHCFIKFQIYILVKSIPTKNPDCASKNKVIDLIVFYKYPGCRYSYRCNGIVKTPSLLLCG